MNQGLKKTLWAAADKLRPNMDTAGRPTVPSSPSEKRPSSPACSRLQVSFIRSARAQNARAAALATVLALA